MARSTEWMRVLDRTGGAVVVRLLAIGMRRKPLPDDPQKIGLIVPTAIGDTILCSGVFPALIDRFPQADLIVFHGSNNAPAVRLIPVRMTCIECQFTNPIATITQLRREGLDMIIDLTPWPNLTAIYARLGAPVAIGFELPGKRRGAAFDIAVPHPEDAHELDNHSRISSLFSNRPYRMSVRSDQFEASEVLEPKRLVLCHTSAGGARATEKEWPTKNWAELARLLAAKSWQVGFTGALADAPMVETILAEAALPSVQAFSLCGRLNLAQLGELIRVSRLLITVDTGILHLAAAVDATILALHGPTHSRCWGARNEKATSLNSSHPAAGYVRYGYEWHPLGYQTMLAHTVEDVARTAFIKLGPPADAWDWMPTDTEFARPMSRHPC